MSEGFPTTRWTLLVAAADAEEPEARDALADLCRAYWFPLYAFIRRKGHDAERAADLTQQYFARFLEKGLVGLADRRRGRFRSFLLADCAHFLADEHDRSAAQKRGGGRSPLSLDVRDADGRYLREPWHQLTAERMFDHAWALALLERVLAKLRGEYERSGRGATFEELKIILTEGTGAVPYAEIARRLGTSEGTIQVSVHKLRRRYGTLLREEILATVDGPEDVDDEIRVLFDALESP